MKHVLGRFIIIAITIYSIMLFVRIILSWIRIPQYRWVLWLCKYTDPVIDYFRKNFPIRIGAIDLSIITPFLILSLLGKLTTDFLIGDYPISIFFNFWYMLQLLLFITLLIFNFATFILIFITLILIIVNLVLPHSQNYQVHPVINAMQNLLNPMITFLENKLKLKSNKNTLIYLIIILVFFIILKGAGSHFLNYLYALTDSNIKIFKDSISM